MRKIQPTRTQQLWRNIKLFMLIWTLVISASSAWNLHYQQERFHATLHSEAAAFHAMEMAYRNWVIHSGGIYVPVSADIQPSPWLSDIPERDIATPSGQKLTLLNSSYVVRLVHENMTGTNNPVRGNIASLNPINPANLADDWERQALERFATGLQEYSSIEAMTDGKAYFRYMKPMMTEQACLKCHARYGDTLGNIRGGVSISIPIDSYLLHEAQERHALLAGHGLIWTVGILGLFFGGKRQHRTIKEAQAREAEVTLLTNSIAHAIYGVNRQGHCTFINAAGLTALGYDDSAELIGKHMHPRVQHSRADGAPYPYETCPSFLTIRDGKSFYRENETFWRKDGSAFPAMYWSYPVVQEGQVQGAVVTFLDISEQLRIQGELKHSQELLNSIVEHIPAMVYLKRAEDLSFELFNRAGEQLLGYSPDQILGKTVHDLFPAEQALALERQDREALASGTPVEIPEQVIKTADGQQKWLHSFKIGLPSSAGAPAYLLGVAIDISTQKRMQDKLRENEAQLAEAQRIAHLGHWRMNHRTDQLTCSDEIYRIFELAPDTGMTYRLFLDCIHPDERSLIEQNHLDSINQRTAFQAEYRLQMPDGRIKHVLEKCETTYAENGQPLCSLGTVQDVTASKLVEQILRDERQVLEHALEGTLHTVSLAAELRDPYTAGHQRRVAELAVAIAQEMGLAKERIHGIRLAAQIHDLGKINVPAEILAKPGKLSEIEFMLIKTHPDTGFEILKDVDFPWPIADILAQHHEKMDGSGYPRGLKGDDILLEARILTVADIVEAVSSHRPYRPKLGIAAALDEIEQGRGTLFDPVVVDACLKLFRERRFNYPD